MVFSLDRNGILAAPAADRFTLLICSIDDRGHLTLARLSRLLANPQLLGELRQSPNAAAVHRTIATAETQLSD
jgi:mannitol/fructose-specific phosphotransferase system IIA component (Ntr-type)